MKIIVRGVVQGVGFRPQVARIAKRLCLSGYVRNVGSYVEIFIDGDAAVFLEEFRRNIPPLSRIESIDIVDEPPSMNYEGFEIAGSATGYKNYMFPNDTALCSECLHELFEAGNRRHLFPFTNCVNCGARYAVIEDLPYDRERTSMRDFPMCPECLREFGDEADRRYDAQTISCPRCGPKYTLYDRAGKEMPSSDPIGEYASALDSGSTGVAKSWGGMHISVILERADSFRSWYRRPTKPFAIMVRDIASARKYAHVSGEEEKLLLSPQRPIVLLDRKDNDGTMLEAVAPGLPNVGIYLPYSGMHHILFSRLKHDAIISTSGNFADEPMVIDNSRVFELGADIYLLHNRRIANRTDDSVVRVLGGRPMFIRKSRGYVPDIIGVGFRGSILSLGAEMNSRVSVTKDGYMFSSQYLGDISHYNNLMFMEETVRRFMKMLDISSLDALSVDMHPQFSYRRFASELAAESGIEVTEVQHHHAHSASLLLDSGADRIVAIALDGTGYGSDGMVWGGEILDAEGKRFSRIGSLEEIPLPGGEAAIREPGRIVYSINELLGRPLEMEYDADIYSRLLRNSIRTTSFGRILDALSAYLRVCDRMRYDGEPAMRLERLLSAGRASYEFDPEVSFADGRRIIRVLPLFERLFSLRLENDRQKADAAYSFVNALAAGLVQVGLDHSVSKALQIGITGGVSYNRVITRMFEKAAGEGKVLMHSRIPNGDGGISAGQCLIASSQ